VPEKAVSGFAICGNHPDGGQEKQEKGGKKKGKMTRELNLRARATPEDKRRILHAQGNSHKCKCSVWLLL